MSVTELARLTLQSGNEAASPALLDNLAKAKDAMMKASGSEFWYYHCVEDPKVIFISDHGLQLNSICKSSFLVGRIKSC
jgi:hypothetical protein